jgi:hypothetical protein
MEEARQHKSGQAEERVSRNQDRNLKEKLKYMQNRVKPTTW